MSGTIFEFEAPNGVVYQIAGAPDEAAARQRARQYFREEFPEQFTAWEREQPTAGFGAAFARSARSAVGGQAAGLGLQLQERGLPGGETLQQAGRAIEGEAPIGQRLLDSETVLQDLQRRPLQTISTGLGQALGSVVGSVAGPAALGAGAIALGAPAGAATIGAAVLGGLLSGTSELYQGLRAEGVPEDRARELAANIGAAIGAVEGGAAGPIVRQILGTTLRREATERLAEVAARTLSRSALREGAQAAMLEGLSEAGAGAARQAVIAGETGNVDLSRRAADVALEGILGAVGGGGVGAATGLRAPARARAELEARLTPEERAAREAELERAIQEPAGAPTPGETAAASAAPEPLVGERPAAFTSREEATDYLAENPPPVGVRTPAAEVAWANARRQAAWENEVEAARPQALSEFTAEPAAQTDPQVANETFFGNLTEAAATDQINLTRFTPQQVASFALQQRGINVKPSAQEVTAIQQRLDSLVQQNYLEQPVENVYRIATGAPQQAAPAQPAEAATQAAAAAAAQPRVDPGAPSVNAGPAQQAAARQAPEAAVAEATLQGVAATGQTIPQPSIQQNANLWRAYELAAGPEVASPIVQAAREVARARRRRLSLNEFNTFANAWQALPSDTDRAIFVQQAIQNARMLGARRGPEVAAPAQPAAPAAPPPPVPPAQPAAAPPPPQPQAQAQAPAQPQPQPQPQAEVPQPEAAPAQAEQVAEPEAEQEGPPSEAIGEDTSPEADVDVTQTDNRIYAALAGVLPPDPVQGRAIIARATRDTFFRKLGRVFASPILTMPRWRPEMASASRVARFLLRRNNQYNVETQNLLARDVTLFTPEQQALMARRLEQSSRDQKPFDRTDLTPEMISKMEDIQRAGQRAFDYFIEANIIKFYDPNEAKTPGARERLLRMWERNRGRNLSQISADELRQASPEGFAVRQQLEGMRNPYYLPMTSDGKTHFIAAYPKGPDGKRKPGAKAVAVVPLDPTSPRFKFSGAPDAEALARQELEARGFTSDKYYVTPKPVEFTRDSEIAQIRDNADFIASFVEKLRSTVGNNAAAQALLRDMQSSLDKARMQGILKPNQGVLIPITGLNESTYLTKTVPQYYAGLGKLQARRYTEHSFKRAIKDLNPADQKYWQDHRDYISAPAEAAWISNMRSFNFHWFMGLAFDTALLNATQVYTGTMPLLMRDGGAQGARITQDTINQVFARFKASAKAAAGRDMNAFVRQISKDLARNPAEISALARAARLEIFTPILTTEAGGISDVNVREALVARGIKNAEAWQKRADWLINLSGLPQRTAETMNRAVTFLAAYRLAQQNPEVIARANRLDGYNFQGPDAAFEYAISRVDDSQLITTAEDRAYFMRFMPGAELLTQFMSYPVKMTEIWITQWRNAIVGMARRDPELAKAGALGLLLFSAPTVFFAGIWGLPGAEFLREALEGIIRLVWKDVENFDDDLRRATGDGFWAKFLTRGFPHASGIAATAQRMGVDPIPFEELANWTPLQIAGPFVGSAADMAINISGYLSRGDYFNALAAAMPRAVGNVMKGLNLEVGTGEFRSPRGNVIISEQQVNDINGRHFVPLSVRQALGLQSPEVADLREAYRIGREISTQTREYAESLNNRLARAEADRFRALRDNDPKAAAEALDRRRRLLEEHGRRNEAYEQAGELDKMYSPNLSTIRRQALEMIYGRTSPEVMGQSGRPAVRSELQEVQRRYSPQ